ncbi:MAG: hypothetical protein R3F24_09285 [Gammaproteobacteria bacterium]
MLAPYLDYARLKRNLSVLDVPAAQHFLDSEKDTQLGNQFRREYLRELARRGQWSQFIDFDVNVRSPGTELRCMRLRALLEAGAYKAARQEFESLRATVTVCRMPAIRHSPRRAAKAG